MMRVIASNSVVLITGASRGVGREAAIEFAAGGTAVALLARNKSELEQVAEEVHRAGGQALVVVADITNRKQVEVAVRTVVENWGRIDVLVNNAGSL